MIDFDKPLKVYVNASETFAHRKLAPNLETLLEDFYLRGDRQRVFFARVEVSP